MSITFRAMRVVNYIEVRYNLMLFTVKQALRGVYNLLNEIRLSSKMFVRQTTLNFPSKIERSRTFKLCFRSIFQ